MTITLKLYASLSAYLPADAQNHSVEINLAEGSTPLDVLERFQVPPQIAHLLLINGVYLEPERRASYALAAGDSMAVWPAVAGG